MISRLFKYVETASVAVIIAVAAIALNNTIKTGEITPDIVPLITLYEHDDKRIYPEAVSYTHLTLPTIYSV